MGISRLCMGKGWILTQKTLEDILDVKIEDVDEIEDMIQNLLDDTTIVLMLLPHDAFDFRSGFAKTEVFDRLPHEQHLKKLASEKTDVYFVGYVDCIQTQGEFGYKVEVPEIVYGLAALLPDIVSHYPKLNETNPPQLNESLGEACIWTFPCCSVDCHCCI